MKPVPQDQILRRLHIDNPWWNTPATIPQHYHALTPRAYFTSFYPLVSIRAVQRAVVLMGPRRVGKTVMLHHTIQRLFDAGVPPSQICYISVDHPLYSNLSPDELLDCYQEATQTQYMQDECYVFFDEIQYIREWERYIKVLVDKHPALKMIVSGSAAAALRLKSQESGAGRFTDFLLPPLTFYEYLALLGQDVLIPSLEHPAQQKAVIAVENISALNAHFLQYINYGGYPEVMFSADIQAAPERFIKHDVIEKVLLRDLPGMYGIQDVQELNALFTTLAFNTSQEVSLEELSKNSGVAKNTIKRYLEYLQAAFLLHIVHRVDRTSRRFRRANFFKVYLTNPSMRSALFSPVAATDLAMGALAETAVFSQWGHDDFTQFHYGRWKTGEVDLVYLDPKTQQADWIVEVKWADRCIERPLELKNVLQFCHTNNLTHATVTTRHMRGRIMIENVAVNFIPTSLYCYAVGAQAIQGKSLNSVHPYSEGL